MLDERLIRGHRNHMLVTMADAGKSVIVDGVRYRWTVEEDPRTGSLSFSHRGMSWPDTVRIVADHGASISFHPLSGMDRYAWWRSVPALTETVIVRAILISQRSQSQQSGTFLDVAARHEAYYGSPIRTLLQELEAATTLAGGRR